MLEQVKWFGLTSMYFVADVLSVIPFGRGLQLHSCGLRGVERSSPSAQAFRSSQRSVLELLVEEVQLPA